MALKDFLNFTIQASIICTALNSLMVQAPQNNQIELSILNGFSCQKF